MKCARVVGDVMGKYHPHGDIGDLRHAGADGAGLLAALPADRRPGQLRLGRRRQRRGVCATPSAGCRRSPPSCSPTSTRKRSISSRTTTARSMEPSVLPSRLPNLLVNGSSGIAVGHGDQHPAAQPDRNRSTRCLALLDNPEIDRRRADRHRPGARFPDRRDHLRPRGRARGLSHRPRPRRDARAHAHRGARQGQPAGDHHRRAPLPGEQGEPARSRIGELVARKEARGHLGPARRVGQVRHARRHRAEARRSRRRSSSTTSSS